MIKFIPPFPLHGGLFDRYTTLFKRQTPFARRYFVLHFAYVTCKGFAS